MVVIPDLHHLPVTAIRPGHIVRVTTSEILSANDIYGAVRGVKHFNRLPGEGHWRIRWDAAVVLGPGEPSTGILYVHGGLVTCISREQWRRLTHPEQPPGWLRPERREITWPRSSATAPPPAQP